MPNSCASLPSESVDGPGIGSASANRSAFSSRQKYWERKSSCRQTICAPPAAASRIFHLAFSIFSLGSSAQLIWIRPARNLLELEERIVLLCRANRQGAIGNGCDTLNRILTNMFLPNASPVTRRTLLALAPA